MSRTCTICQSGRRAEIDSALLEHRAGYRFIAARFGMSYGSLRRHEATHLAAVVQRAREEQLMRSAEDLATELEDLHQHVRTALERAEQAGDDRLALLAVREGRANVEVLAKLSLPGEIEARLKALEDAKAGR